MNRMNPGQSPDYEYQEIDSVSWQSNYRIRLFFKTCAFLTLFFFLSTQIDSRWVALNNTLFAQETASSQPEPTQTTQPAERPAEEEEETQTTQHLPSTELPSLFDSTLSLTAATESTEDDEDKDAYKEFSPDFFDLIVIDECHRRSAAEDSAWRSILEYFSKATHIGLTATPKETDEVSNIEYFGNPLYTYSLKQGIEDGFLAPYKVIRIGLNVDLEGWRPDSVVRDSHGDPVEDRIYNT